MNTISDRIRAKRRELRMSQADLASQSGISRGTIIAIEGGAAENAAPKTLGAIASALAIDYVWLLYGDDGPPQPRDNHLSDLEVMDRHIAHLEAEIGVAVEALRTMIDIVREKGDKGDQRFADLAQQILKKYNPSQK